MERFDKITFQGAFRSYQQHVLDHADDYLADGKIHIVAAPGSGKTVLGLELIRRLNQPALILSPTVTIRQQWGERFADKFLLPDAAPENYVSYSLEYPQLITSITYQALHLAYQQPEGLMNTIHSFGIRTICLDEAHHLRSEWQKALEGFLQEMREEVKIIALTATPPYDSTPAEWNRYMTLCGEIDDEIYVPELVQEGSICPHQDYIYFNFPRSWETEVLREFRERSVACTAEILSSGLLNELMTANGILTNYSTQKDDILEYPKEYIALLCLTQYNNISIPLELIKLLCQKKTLPRMRMEYTERAFSFVLEHPELFREDLVIQLKEILAQNRLLRRGKPILCEDPNVDKALISSAGKLISIQNIAATEFANMGKDLRMLVLTDYIHKDLLHLVESDEQLDVMGTVPVFEAVRRAVGDRTYIGLLSGSLVLLPNEQVAAVSQIAADLKIPVSPKPLADTSYCQLSFSGGNRNSVAVLTQAFSQELIQILVGTKSLLGEGWDSPCINSLILASFVGSFVLSNQMRGRAIRVDLSNPDKTANIWHLVTAEPHITCKNILVQSLCNQLFADDNILVSKDFKTLERRFDCFLAPAYHKDTIENGIERIDIIEPPFDEKGIEKMNQKTLSLAADRQNMAQSWKRSGGSSMEILDIRSIPKEVQATSFTFTNVLFLGMVTFILTVFTNSLLGSMNGNSLRELAIYLAFVVILLSQLAKGALRLLKWLSPERTVRTLCDCLFKTLQDMGEIKRENTRIVVKADPYGLSINCALAGGSVHEKNLFSIAVGEMLSSIENPRYIFAERKRYERSYACPSIIGKNQKNVEMLQQHLNKAQAELKYHYCRNEEGRRILLKCRRRSYINRNDLYIRNRRAASDSNW